MIIERPLWWDKTEMPPTHEVTEECDVVIIGGGITGLIAGIELLKGGTSVMILDAMSPGQGASGRAFGSIAIGSSVGLSELQRRHGQEDGKRLWLEASSAAQVLHQYIQENVIDCDYRNTGHIRLAVKKSHEDGLRADFKLWSHTFGEGDIHLLSAQDLRSVIPSNSFRLGLLDKLTATIDPYRYVASLLRLFSEKGGRYVAECAVNVVHKKMGVFFSKHGKGVTRSREILIASNGYTSNLIPWLGRRIFPVGSYMIATAPLPNELRKTFDNHLRVCSTAFNLKNYFRMSSDGRLIFGGRSNLASGGALAKIATELKIAMIGYFPSLHEVTISHVWGGNLGFTFDGIPHLGKQGGMFYGMGYCGRGLPMATLFGIKLAHLINGTETAIPEHGRIPLRGRWYYRGAPWFLPLAATYYRWKDRRSH